VIGFDQLGIVKTRQGNRLAEDSPRNTYQTADGRWIGISASSQKTFERLCAAMGAPELAHDPRYATNALRCEHADALDATVAAWFRTRTQAEAMAVFDAADVVAGPILDISDIMRDPHYAARNDIVEVPDADFGTVRMQGVTPRFVETPGEVRHAGRSLGADNRAVFVDTLGLPEAEFERLTAAGVI
jgi:crotonobetainyl-CoA:carnitine CoA-transferase CaiB-like acyl-CoA transferase